MTFHVVGLKHDLSLFCESGIHDEIPYHDLIISYKMNGEPINLKKLKKTINDKIKKDKESSIKAKDDSIAPLQS